jgi:CRISPR/Cas system-associated exonuclease Cas4 (RecB family)
MDEAIRLKYFSFADKEKKKTTPKKKKLPEIVKKIQSFIPKPINYAFEKTISYTQLSTYNTCPKKWNLQYKEENYLYENNIFTVFGTSIHETIQNYLNVFFERSGAEADRIDIEQYFEESFKNNYLKDYKTNNNTHFSDPIEMKEFFDDGIEILKSFKKKRNKYFSKKGWYLVGCEIPLLITPNSTYKNILYKGFLDIVLYHEPTNTIKIIDIKTSTYSWGKEKKSDENKQFQLILYKKLFSEQYNFPLENINIEFFIVKRKLYQTEDYILSRIQTFTPSSGKIKISRAEKNINSFIETVFSKDGKYLEKELTPNPSPTNCKYCAFSKHPNLCPIGSKFI